MKQPKEEVIEPEILDETGQLLSPDSPKDHARPQGDNGGLLGGLLVLTVGFLATVCVILFSLLILVPLKLLGRLLVFLLGVHRR